jgi:hypothetical protein
MGAVTLALLTVLFVSLGSSPAQQAEGEDALYDQMLAMDDARAVLRKAMRDPARNEECLKLVVVMQKAAMECKLLSPPHTADQPEGDRAAYVARFRKGLIGVIHELLNLEAAFLDGDDDKAKEIYEKIEGLEEKGHDDFS